jgi:hypothetical protein
MWMQWGLRKETRLSSVHSFIDSMMRLAVWRCLDWSESNIGVPMLARLDPVGFKGLVVFERVEPGGPWTMRDLKMFSVRSERLDRGFSRGLSEKQMLPFMSGRHLHTYLQRPRHFRSCETNGACHPDSTRRAEANTRYSLRSQVHGTMHKTRGHSGRSNAWREYIVPCRFGLYEVVCGRSVVKYEWTPTAV